VPAIIGVVGGIAGAVFGGRISERTTALNAKAQLDLQNERFKREERAARLSTIAALRDLVQYAGAAAAQAHYNVNLWEPSVATLASRVSVPETVYGFTDEEWAAVANAASVARLGLVRLQGLASDPTPLSENLDRVNQEVDRDQTHYVATIRDVGLSLYSALRTALAPLGNPLPNIDFPPMPDLVDGWRQRIGQRPLLETRQNPSGPCIHPQS
jgi:hypothetical protein